MYRGEEEMVTFKLVEQTEKNLIYWYYPENHQDSEPGIITVDLEKDEIEITKVAADDFVRDIHPEEINSLIDSINEMRQERGETDLEEHVTESEHSIMYGDHAVREIIKYLRKGEIPKKGMQMWY